MDDHHVEVLGRCFEQGREPHPDGAAAPGIALEPRRRVRNPTRDDEPQNNGDDDIAETDQSQRCRNIDARADADEDRHAGKNREPGEALEVDVTAEVAEHRTRELVNEILCRLPDNEQRAREQQPGLGPKR